jgi:glycosyltransferase involved in cell wall biosynthesis
MKPKVTIIIATYNRAHFIVETLHSIQEQTFENWECLIIDDGGTDNTLAVITPVLEYDPRFKYLKRPGKYKKGIPGCRNYGIDIARGDYIIFFDDDDIVHPQNLELCMEAFQINKIYFCVYDKKAFFDSSNTINFQEENINIDKPISALDIEAIITNRISIASCTVMWKKECFLNEKFNESLLYAEEWECYPRVISNNKYGIKLMNVLYFNRKHALSNTGEFYANDTIRVIAKKLAIRLLVINLSNKNLLTPILHKYFTGLAISFRDDVLLNDILIISKTEQRNKLYLKLKFHSFPLWRLYKRMNKILIKK